MVWEKKGRDEEAIADMLYAQLEEDKSSSPPSPRTEVPETIQVDKVVGDLTVYRYVENVSGIAGEPGNEENIGAVFSTPSEMNRFDILGKSPYNDANPIPLDVTLPAGTYYQIQMGAFGSEVEPDAFQGISPITGERIRERNLIKYYAGKFSRYDDASSALSRVRTKGYEDAFIVAWYNGKMISTQKAKQLE